MQPIVLYFRLRRRIENLQESAIVRLINCKIIFNRILSRHFLKLYLLKSIMVGNKMIKRILYGNYTDILDITIISYISIPCI